MFFRLDEGGGGGGGNGSVALAAAREDAEQARRREKSIQYELDQARHAISNLKVINIRLKMFQVI